MSRKIKGLLLLIFITVTIFTCINPYMPDLSAYKTMMVVEGHVTNQNRSYTVKLSNSMQSTDSIHGTISDASVSVVDDQGTVFPFVSAGGGIYKSDSLTFRGEVGKTYKLKIRTAEGSEFESDWCKMLPVPDIDSLYFEKDEHLVRNQTAIKKGVSIYVDVKPGLTDNYYLRWDYNETWKFKVPFPKTYNYVHMVGIIEIPGEEVKEYCWKTAESSDILADAFTGLTDYQTRKKPVTFIASDESDRLTVRYSIDVTQYSISEQEYHYMQDLIKENQSEGDIFGPQPFEVLGNVRNINDPSVKIPGYFEVSAVSEKRLYINASDIYTYNLPQMADPCRAYSLDIYDLPFNPYVVYTWWDVYYHFSIEAGMTFIKPVYADLLKESLQYFVFTSPKCADCELSGSFVRPIFWTDQ